MALTMAPTKSEIASINAAIELTKSGSVSISLKIAS